MASTLKLFTVVNKLAFWYVSVFVTDTHTLTKAGGLHRDGSTWVGSCLACKYQARLKMPGSEQSYRNNYFDKVLQYGPII